MRVVSLDWLAEHLEDGDLQVLDPRTRERYLSGHLAGAVHVPMREAFGDGALLPPAELAAWLGRRGVASDRPIVVYDDYDGQKGTTLAWIIELLGHHDVALLDAPFLRWRERGGELFYRPVRPGPTSFAVTVRTELRSTREQVAAGRLPLLDVRSAEEYAGGEAPPGEVAGHIPGASHVPWLAFVRDGDALFVGEEDVGDLLAAVGLRDARELIVYCRSGPRAALAATVLRLAGRDASVYDGSFLDWTRASMPLE